MNRSNVTLTFTVRSPQTGEVLHETSVRYVNLKYVVLVAMEKGLLAAGQELTKLADAEVKSKK